MCKGIGIVNLVFTYGTEKDVLQARYYLYFFVVVLAKLGKNVS